MQKTGEQNERCLEKPLLLGEVITLNRDTTVWKIGASLSVYVFRCYGATVVSITALWVV